MALKDQVLSLLLTGEYLSGESAAKKLGVSRTAVWKAVEALRQDGCKIEAVTNRGYILVNENLLSEESVRCFLPDKLHDMPIYVYKSVTSTNDVAKEAAEAGRQDAVFIANEQTSGRGRMGRKFISEANRGVYMSFLLHPGCPAEDSALLTTAAAVAVCRAAESVADVICGIKWVNDVCIKEKKLAGILCEGAFGFESGQLNYAIVGIGTNIKAGAFPAEIADRATSLETEAGVIISRSRYAAALIEAVVSVFSDFSSGSFMDEYRARSFVTGRRIRVNCGTESYEATAEYITDRGALVASLPGGERRTLSSGEVSIIPIGN